MKDIIEWHQAKDFPEKRKQDQQKYIEEFLGSDCTMFNGRDLNYYHEKTGKDLNWIIDNGKNIQPLIKTVYFDTKSLDDVWDYDHPVHNWDEDDSDDETSVDWEPSKESISLFRSIINGDKSI